MSEEQTQKPETEQTLSTPVAQATKSSALGVPIAIVIGAIIIAGAVIYTGENNTTTPTVPTGNSVAQEEQQTPEAVVAPITEDDHIRGNPNAPIVIVEYSDYDCPFCKRFHEATMMEVMNEYGESGEVAWVYRQFPLEQLHPNAPKISEASECVAELGGNEAFWAFSDLVFGERGTNSPTDMTALPGYAVQAGVDEAAFTECLNSGKYAQEIVNDVQAAIQAGARGTPYSVILVNGQQNGIINGAQPFANVKATIDAILQTL